MSKDDNEFDNYCPIRTDELVKRFKRLMAFSR